MWRQERHKNAWKKVGCLLFGNCPEHSPDLDDIKNMWAILRQRLHFTESTAIETRIAFLTHPRRTLTWLNGNKQEHTLHLCTNQKERAKEILQLSGARCKW